MGEGEERLVAPLLTLPAVPDMAWHDIDICPVRSGFLHHQGASSSGILNIAGLFAGRKPTVH